MSGFYIALKKSVATYSTIGSGSIAAGLLFNAQMTLGCNSICNSISSSGFWASIRVRATEAQSKCDWWWEKKVEEKDPI